eukprot:265600-Chlamydomonas_euryale.AAC.1
MPAPAGVEFMEAAPDLSEWAPGESEGPMSVSMDSRKVSKAMKKNKIDLYKWDPEVRRLEDMVRGQAATQAAMHAAVGGYGGGAGGDAHGGGRT